MSFSDTLRLHSKYSIKTGGWRGLALEKKSLWLISYVFNSNVSIKITISYVMAA